MYSKSGKPRASRGGLPTHVLYILVSALCLGLLVIMWNVYQLRSMQQHHMIGHGGGGPYPRANIEEAAGGVHDGAKRPIVWIHGKHVNSGYLDHVMAVFDRTGYIKGSQTSSWDVLWAHDYPFTELSAVIAKLKPYQKVNHFPGTGFITNKVFLATSNIDYIPKAFSMPKQMDAFLQETKSNKETLWVQKSSSHRGIKVKAIEELDLQAANTFIQQYIANPYLIDGKKFDLGFYVTLASVDPLRVYVLPDEMLVRFCAKDYHPIDFADVNKYVVGDDYTPVWEMPSIKKYYKDHKCNFMESMNAYWRSKDIDPDKIYHQVFESIKGVFLNKYTQLVNALKKYDNKRAFFELMRFDFVLDEELNVYLMEVNMSPNLSSAHFKQNVHLYERVVYNVLSVNGIARNLPFSMKDSDAEKIEMRMSEREIPVKTDTCSTGQCNSCEPLECKLCHHCLTQEQRSMLQEAYIEHNNRQSMRRVYPESMTQEAATHFTPSSSKELTENDHILQEWFALKCARDLSFCQ